MKKIKYQALSKVEKALIAEAEVMLPLAYNPYFHFQVGAAILTASG